MKWYAAHVITWLKLEGELQSTYPIRENIILVSGESEDIAFKKVERQCIEDEMLDDSVTWDNKPATWVYGGIRKLIECLFPEEQPNDGTEITYSEMTVESEDALRKLIAGDPVAMIYEI